ncbi:hypothetical protein ACFLEY_01610 [Bradyrhizobium sp. YCK136]|uniref:Uncharacterized protein n=1 Tax=Bradyrhizobium diazoefficiens TaxID=1355477 RepID=A0A0E4BQB3_9BRAD|nr:hypothetical protein [Bradyrhizobium diazoefficiens]MBR0868267.1 hypothetical protein [Bradyrhizobium diazoefficiens]MBR0892784.1 hypothetical protein [Bradyrhizobium diazoefficiens]MBR0924469.1 hypothetical protein [Bradyrhizobium diazoefficiens]BAR57294.1 hypothetical protein NK6_4125 [Bradyrhizobium diazoefficiens]
MTDDEIKAQAAAKAQAERDELIAALQNRTALGRLALTEANTVFDVMAELGFAITKAG